MCAPSSFSSERLCFFHSFKSRCHFRFEFGERLFELVLVHTFQIDAIEIILRRHTFWGRAEGMPGRTVHCEQLPLLP